MKTVWILTAAILTAFTVRAELVENGNFSKRMAYWDLASPPVYGAKPSANINDGALELSGMRSASGGYMTLNQAVEIRKGVSYRITFEAKGDPAGGEYLVVVQDPGEAAHVALWLKTETSWKQETIDFTGAYDTDGKWVKAWIKGMKNAELRGGETVNKNMGGVRDPEADGPVRSWLSFAIGKLAGSFSIRNISITEVP